MRTTENVYRNLTIPELIEQSLKRGEGVLTATGALAVNTGKYTGRSPEDRFIVDEPEVHDEIDWGKVNRPFPPERFAALHNKLLGYFSGRAAFVCDGLVGADPTHRLNVRVITSLAYHSLFATQIFRRPTKEELNDYTPDFTVISAPKFKADPVLDGTHSEAFIIISFAKRIVLIGGTEYAGEIKKSLFSVMNYLLPKRGVLPMHCSANVGVYDDVALFFGLSGTGKTTLSADPDRRLIGDDEHGWSEHGVFNIEGGCYAKCIGLSKEQEPQIFHALTFGSLIENVVLDEHTRHPDYNDDSITENTRACYPVEFIPNAVLAGQGGLPQTIVFLTADAFGVLPPVARLSREQAMYHFISGYTSKLAGTERGITRPEATFSACFGSPFLPLHPTVYANLLGEKISQSKVRVFLVNTGWTGGGHGSGKRISIAYTRAIITAILSGDLDKCSYQEEPIFQLLVPELVPGLPISLLTPRLAWEDHHSYDATAHDLAARFRQNFAQFGNVPPAIAQAGPLGRS
ncbi:MAG: Phosphoenolpyruvate carboxykinase (ATP) [Firmicutes bacterium]|nr:Phosphoenolpyruvate carboxykinase (ATP) [Bacillota bacterium]MBT9158254.1 Phosphoenolpyruvate carboxykinase (ATP) [Bacillota bacterium]